MWNEEDIGEPWKKNSSLDETLQITFQYILCSTSFGVAGCLLARAIGILDKCSIAHTWLTYTLFCTRSLLFYLFGVLVCSMLHFLSLNLTFNGSLRDQRSKRSLKIMRQRKRLIGMSILSWHLKTHDLCPCLVSSPCSIVLNSLFTTVMQFLVIPCPSIF